MNDHPTKEAGRERPVVGVFGLWHLGSVTAACLAEAGFATIGIDLEQTTVADLSAGIPPIGEPGLAELTSAGLEAGTLRFAEPNRTSLAALDVLWVTFDTPVDEEDRADSEWVIGCVRDVLVDLGHGALVVVSSQLPVGSVRRLEELARAAGRDDLAWACVPENLRLGTALASFRSAERYVAGVRDESSRERLADLLASFTDRVEWMGVESAEMTKHALNSFLATSVAFINEIAVISEVVGADASEVSRGLKSDRRIGPRSYLGPGDAFAGGTLARDISSLNAIAAERGLSVDLLAGVGSSNDNHRRWARRVLVELIGDGEEAGLSGKRIAIWGLAYKPGTDTLRRSSAIDLARWLHSLGASVVAHDPSVRAVPEDVAPGVLVVGSPQAAATDADALVVSTGWPEFREVTADEVTGAMRTPVVLDAAGFLAATLGVDAAISYNRVGVMAR